MEGPYVLRRNIGEGCYELSIVDGDSLFQVNVRYLKIWQVPVLGGHTLLSEA